MIGWKCCLSWKAISRGGSGRSGLVGPNGAGKTNIFRLIMGEVMR